jgi:hypothetical protein
MTPRFVLHFQPRCEVAVHYRKIGDPLDQRRAPKAKKSRTIRLFFDLLKLAEPTGFEPATSDVTGRRSNQLNYDSALELQTCSTVLRTTWWAVLVSNQ